MKKPSLQSGNKSGFTLPEVIVSISIIVIVIVAATNLIVSIIRTNTQNQNTLIAYGLAQEGLEGVRNIRDSDWLIGASFQGKLGSKTNPKIIWGQAFPDFASMDSKYYHRFYTT